MMLQRIWGILCLSCVSSGGLKTSIHNKLIYVKKFWWISSFVPEIFDDIKMNYPETEYVN